MEKAEAAGSLRRGQETVGDIDLLCAVKKTGKLTGDFAKKWGTREVLSSGPSKSSIIIAEGLQVDLRVVEKKSFGSALLYFTGSKSHNIRIRELALKKGYTVNEYGIFSLKEKNKGRSRQLAGKTEEDMFRFLGLDFIPPELREDRGEIEAAAGGKLPALLEPGEIRGDLHVHSHYSDGENTILELALEAERRGLEWIVVADHSQSLKVAGGLDRAKLKLKKKELDEARKKTKVKLFFGSEVDILADGELDYPDEILKDLDFVIAAVHSRFKDPEDKMTARIVKALQNPYSHMLAHPTGRLIGKREAYQVNLERIMETAEKNGKILEINAFPDRQDLTDIYAKKAGERGVRLGIGTDSHSFLQMEYMRIGVTVARRGWLEKKNVINTLT
ncbi:MAG TPA: PHP domain-containing protein, partial [bacterium]|nr:PHP domain-containing protein [bacterium]